MWTKLFRVRYLTALLLCFPVLYSPLAAQQRLDMGVHLTPQLLPIRSTDVDLEWEGTEFYTKGENGQDIGFSFGGYLEYEVVRGLFLRGGIDMVRKRYRYAVRVNRADASLNETGINRVAYTALEVPLAVIYRFDYLANNDRFLIGVGAIANRWVGDPQLKTAFYSGSSNRPPFRYSPYAVTAFGGFEHFISSRLVLGLEPYVSYLPTPTEFRLETRSRAVASIEAGLSLRLRFDN